MDVRTCAAVPTVTVSRNFKYIQSTFNSATKYNKESVLISGKLTPSANFSASPCLVSFKNVSGKAYNIYGTQPVKQRLELPRRCVGPLNQVLYIISVENSHCLQTFYIFLKPRKKKSRSCRTFGVKLMLWELRPYFESPSNLPVSLNPIAHDSIREGANMSRNNRDRH